mmetsp:Transcript_18018/g.47590  ORF Transcript_18018/g.47590 Transcript_18018/m.47590 type:complete len:208 (-) Transcript_18018:2-625(-)
MMACWCCMTCCWNSCCFVMLSKKAFFSLCSTTFCRASLKLGRISSFSSMPSLMASPFANATCIGPSSRCSGIRMRCSWSSSMALSACSRVPILTNAQPTPLCACEAMMNTSRTSPHSSKHSVICLFVTSRGRRPTNSFTPPFSRSTQGRLSFAPPPRSPRSPRSLLERPPRRLGDLRGLRLRLRRLGPAEGLRVKPRPVPPAPMGAP